MSDILERIRNPQAKRMSNFDTHRRIFRFAILWQIFVFALWVGIAYVVITVGMDVSDRGLKAVATEIWEGPQHDR